MNEVLFSKIQNVLLDLVCNKTNTMTVDDATNELIAIFEAAHQHNAHVVSVVRPDILISDDDLPRR